MMKKPYTLLDHTADLRVRIFGKSMPGLFKNAGLALGELICSSGRTKPDTSTTIEITGEDPADLMVSYLREILYLWTGREQLVCGIEILDLSDQALSARIDLTHYHAGQHDILHEIKAVTYHQIAVEPVAGGWHAMVVFDI